MEKVDDSMCLKDNILEPFYCFITWSQRCHCQIHKEAYTFEKVGKSILFFVDLCLSNMLFISF